MATHFSVIQNTPGCSISRGVFTSRGGGSRVGRRERFQRIHIGGVHLDNCSTSLILSRHTYTPKMSSKPPAMVPGDDSQTIAPPAKPSQPNGASTSTSLPKLPIPKLEDTCKRYLRALEGLQDEEEHSKTQMVVQKFLTGGEGEKWQKKLEEYNSTVDSYIEEFWCECCKLLACKY